MSVKGNGWNRRTIDLARRQRQGSAVTGDMTGEGARAMGVTRTHAPGWLLRVAAVLVAGGLLAGCSDTWDTVSRPLDPLPPADPQDIEAPQQGAGEYPSLSSVPDAPPRRPSGREDRQEIRDSLSADRANARYSDQQQTGEGIATRSRDGADGSGDAEASANASGGSDASSSDGPAGAPERPDVAERMPADDAGAPSRREAAQPSGAQQSDSPTSGTRDRTRSAAQPTAGSGSDGGGTAAPDVPQLEQSQEGEPIEVPAQPTFDDDERSGAGQTGPSSSAGSSAGQRGRAQQQQSASRQTDSSARAPRADAGQSRTLSRQDAGGQTMADGGRRVAVIYFRHGSASLQGRDREVLRKVAEVYERQGRDLRVVGHASSRTAAMDPVDHRMANFDTSLKRAQAVVDALVSMGVPRDAIQLEARGDNEPVYHEFMPTGEAGNRRAEIFLQG